MALPRPMFEEGNEPPSAAASAGETASINRHSRASSEDRFCQDAPPLNRNNVMNISTAARGEKLFVSESNESRTSEESVETGKTSSGISIQQIVSEKNPGEVSASLATSDSRETPPLEGRISNVTHSSPESATSQGINPLTLFAEAHARSISIANAVLEDLRIHPENNKVSDLLPAYSEIRTLAQEKLAFVKNLPIDDLDKEALAMKTTDIVLNLLDVAHSSFRLATKEEDAVYDRTAYDPPEVTCYDTDVARYFNRKDILMLQRDLKDVKKVLENSDQPVGKALAKARQERADRTVIYLMEKDRHCSYDEPHWSTATNAKKSAVTAQRLLRSVAPIADPLEARRAVVNDMLQLMAEGLKASDRQMQVENSSSALL